MSDITVVFQYEQKQIKLYCKGEDYMKNIFQKFINKIDEKNINDFCFLYSDKNIDNNIKLKDNNKIKNMNPKLKL